MNNMFNNSTDGKKPEQSERKELILDAFEKLVVQYGMDRTTMQEIAKTAGVSVGTLYNEYRDKDALIDAFVDRVESQMGHEILTIRFSSDSPEDQLREFVFTVTNMVTKLLHNKRPIIDYFLTGASRFRYIGMKIKDKSRTEGIINTKIKEIIKSGVNKGVFKVDDIDKAALVLSYAYTTFIAAHIFMGEQDTSPDDELRRYAIELLIKGLRK